MRILLVEDEAAAVDVFQEDMATANLANDIVVARSRVSALEKLSTLDFDLVVCDLLIPSTDDALDLAEGHGLVVVQESVERQYCAPVLVLTGHGSLDNLSHLINRPERDVYGTGHPIGMVTWMPKTDPARYVKRIGEIALELEVLDGIEVHSPDLPLSHQDERTLQIYARSRGGVLVRVAQGVKGLSEAAIVTIDIEGENGQRVGSAFVKLDKQPAIEDERDRFTLHVAGVLPPAAHAPLMACVPVAGGRAGLFYGLIRAATDSLFNLLSTDQTKAVEIVRALESIERETWLAGAPTRRTTVGAMRRMHFNDEALIGSSLVGLDWRSLERKPVQVREAVQHGDLHGANVLIDARGRPFLVDFAKTGRGFAALDSVQLELSLWCHQEGRRVVGSWPPPDDLRSWANDDLFARTGPVPDFILALRTWASHAAAGRREMLATAYSHAVKQLKYPDVDPELVRALVGAVMAAW